jgi:hypothetical protein
VDAACELVLGTLLALKRDLQAGRISADDGVFVLDSLRVFLDDLRAAEVPAPFDPRAPEPVLLLGAPGRDPLDELVLEIARVLLRAEHARLEVLSLDLMPGEALAQIEAKAPAAVIVPSLPPAGLTSARHLMLRLRARLPKVVVIGARLGDPDGEVAERVAMLEAAGCTEVAASLPALKAALERIVRAAQEHKPVPVQPAPLAAARNA